MVTLGYTRNNKLTLVPAVTPSILPGSKRKNKMTAPFDVYSERLYPQSETSTVRGDDASIAPSQAETLTPERDGMMRFTATGRPMPAYNPSSLRNMADSPLGEAPQFLPMKFTDESILNIPIPYEDIYPPEREEERGKEKERRPSFFGRLKIGGGKGEKGRKKEGFKMVRMTRGEYLMYWAKDEHGKYIGTEPEGRGREVFGDRLL